MEKRKKIDIAPIVDLGSNSYFWLFEYENNKTEFLVKKTSLFQIRQPPPLSLFSSFSL